MKTKKKSKNSVYFALTWILVGVLIALLSGILWIRLTPGDNVLRIGAPDRIARETIVSDRLALLEARMITVENLTIQNLNNQTLVIRSLQLGLPYIDQLAGEGSSLKLHRTYLQNRRKDSSHGGD